MRAASEELLGAVELELSSGAVRAEDRRSGEPLPQIPPRWGLGLRFQGSRLSGFVEARRSDRQGRVAAFETPTDAYTLLNAELGYRFFLGPTVSDLMLRGSNLTDEEARSHVSFLKDVAPLPGRDVSLVYRLAF